MFFLPVLFYFFVPRIKLDFLSADYQSVSNRGNNVFWPELWWSAYRSSPRTLIFTFSHLVESYSLNEWKWVGVLLKDTSTCCSAWFLIAVLATELQLSRNSLELQRGSQKFLDDTEVKVWMRIHQNLILPQPPSAAEPGLSTKSDASMRQNTPRC